MSAGDSTRIIGQMNYFLGSFLETSLNNILAPGGKVTWVPSQEAYREGVIWLQEQFAKGNLDATIFSMTADQFKRLGDGEDGPAFGIVHALNPYAFASDVPPVITDDRNPASIMKVLPPLEGPSGLRTCGLGLVRVRSSPPSSSPSSCQDPITMIRWADYQYELGLTIAMKAGEQGTGWEFSDKGAKGIDGQQADLGPNRGERDRQPGMDRVRPALQVVVPAKFAGGPPGRPDRRGAAVPRGRGLRATRSRRPRRSPSWPSISTGPRRSASSRRTSSPPWSRGSPGSPPVAPMRPRTPTGRPSRRVSPTRGSSSTCRSTRPHTTSRSEARPATAPLPR